MGQRAALSAGGYGKPNERTLDSRPTGKENRARVETPVQRSQVLDAAAPLTRRCSLWVPAQPPTEIDPASQSAEGVRWFDLVGDHTHTSRVLEHCGPTCAGLKG